ncbi:MAG TPA: hypothetical protein VN947_01595 [Polyangia bacterium]|nr:hypothetical protein [Polyangia bacterium]
MGAEEVLDEVATADNLEALLRKCAHNLPGDSKPDLQTWGGPAATELMSRLRGSPLEAEASRIFERFFREGDEDQVRLAQSSANPAVVDVAAIEAALARTELSAETHGQVRSALARALAAQPSKLAVRHRALASQLGGQALIGALIVADHAWFLGHVAEVLGADATDACNRLWYGLQALHRAEGERLRLELDGMRAALGDAYAQGLVETIDGEAETLRDRDGAIRWPTVALVPSRSRP